MSFLTEYFDEYREHPIRKMKPCRPEDRYAKLEGIWLDPKKGKQDKEMNDEDIKEFIKKTMKSLRGQSTYFNDYCAHLNPEFKTRPFVPRVKKRRPCHEVQEQEKSEEVLVPQGQKLALKDTELMKIAHDLYERDLDAPTLKPLDTSTRILGYVRPRLYKTGLSEYQGEIARVAYELVRDSRIPQYVASNGGRPRWGYPPEGTRQPLQDVAPFDGERLY
ncbi:uncharacterized protein LOC126375719 isoform X2 [Pectinophora gossypiella]|uniref:uncharacterized protein LOC126375719 isoform X2 n=1 Tax=Pectinophora gossypiella TaxID=13191 RepID=UPI00214F1F8C|nr:uncharacterized protein LOC126375719 isoform X2 [Pectinophora gossypiella]